VKKSDSGKRILQEKRQARAWAGLIHNLARKIPKKPLNHELPGQPFDRLLLQLSPIYRRSRELFLSCGGIHTPSLHSSPRSLASLSLVSRQIEYSPLEAELIWTATDPTESRTRPERLLDLRTWVTGVFHEQNHRVLWNLLPPPLRGGEALRRHLHFAESLVVMLDMALADSLPRALSEGLYQVGSIYDPGTPWLDELRRARFPARRTQRYHWNALQAACEATFLNLELFDPEQIPGHITAIFPTESAPPATRGTQSLITRAAQRALRLDRLFVEQTNPEWLRKQGAKAGKALLKLKSPGGPDLNLGRDLDGFPARNLHSERVLSHYCT